MGNPHLYRTSTFKRAWGVRSRSAKGYRSKASSTRLPVSWPMTKQCSRMSGHRNKLAWATPLERLHRPIPLLDRADEFQCQAGNHKLHKAGTLTHPKPGLMKHWRGVCTGHQRREGKTWGGQGKILINLRIVL